MRQTITAAMFAALLIAGPMSGAAVAADGNKGDEKSRDATALQGAKVTLIDAIRTAEQQTGGLAYDAGVDAEDGKVRIVVETNGPTGIQTVSIDVQSGQVIGSHAGDEQD